MTRFEFDRKKSRSNLNKHGIDFEEAQGIWDDLDFIEIQAKSGTESRSLNYWLYCRKPLVSRHHLSRRYDPNHFGEAVT